MPCLYAALSDLYLEKIDPDLGLPVSFHNLHEVIDLSLSLSNS